MRQFHRKCNRRSGQSVLIAQSCLTLCDSMDHSPPGPSVHAVLQIRILEWVTIPFSRGSAQPRDETCVSFLADRLFTIEPPGKPHSCIKLILTIPLNINDHVFDGGLVTKSCLTLVTPWTTVCKAPLSMGFSRQEYCSGQPFPSPGDLPNPGIKPGLLHYSRFFTV